VYVKNPSRSANRFFAAHPVFTVAEFETWYAFGRATSDRTVGAVLAYHAKSGHLVRIRKGLYAAVPAVSEPASTPVDPFLVASKLTPDAILAYHTALELHGKAHTPMQEFFYLSGLAARPLEFRGQRFRAVRPPVSLRAQQDGRSGILAVDRVGLRVLVTSLERTLVDILDRPHFGGGWEEIWRSLEAVEFFDLDSVVEYALLLGNSTTIAKVGFFLEQHREALMVEDRHLAPLRKRRPRNPHYLSRGERHPGKLLAGWNLVVPPAILEKGWQEVV
jgi:predicted transcriptional regulator of viral defense system